MEYYGTLGPSCQDEETLLQMFDRGMTGMRLNLSHVTLEESRPLLCTYQRAARRAGVQAGLVIDLQGPELRVGRLEAPLPLREGGEVLLGPGGIPLPALLLDALEVGTELLLDDGALLLRVESLREGGAVCRILRGGVLHSAKSVAAPSLKLHPPSLTEADRQNLSHAGDCGVTAVLQPFVRGGADLLALRQELQRHRLDHVKVIAKIENRQGMAMLEEICAHADEICIARGDLGNDMPLWELPEAQKRIAATCRRLGKPFLVVTQMLHSMVGSPVPTRAEVSDIFNAVLDGASALMLTGETAIGSHPAAAMEYLWKTGERALAYREETPT